MIIPSRTTLALILSNLISVIVLGTWIYLEKGNYEELKKQKDQVSLELRDEKYDHAQCQGSLDGQNKAIENLAAQTAETQKTIKESVAEAAKIKQESINKVYDILNRKVPSDCAGAVQHARSTAKELSSW